MKTYISIFLLSVGLGSTAYAQKGIGTLQPSKASVLDITATQKGVLIPRVALSSTTDFNPINGEVDAEKRNGILVYNSVTVVGANGVQPGFYYWTQTNETDGKWNRLRNDSDLDIPLSGDITGTIKSNTIAANAVNTAKITTASIVNEDVVTSANISLSKLKPGTPNQILKNVSGVPTWVTPIPLVSSDNNNIYFTEAANHTKNFLYGGGAGSSQSAGAKLLFMPSKGGAIRAGEFTAVSLTNIGEYSIAFGKDNTASGRGSSVLNGELNTASGDYATAMGAANSAPSYAETVLGSYNTNYVMGANGATSWNVTDRLFSVGNGTADNARSNALTLLKNGNLGLGVDAPTAKLEINGQIRLRGGSPGLDKVLVSDATGLASWVSTPESTPDIFNSSENDVFLGSSLNYNKVFNYSTATNNTPTDGVQLTYFPNNAFRAGDFNTFSLNGIRVHSVGMGYQTYCYDNSFSFGNQATNYWNQSFASGYLTFTDDYGSGAFGFRTRASTRSELALGSLNTFVLWTTRDTYKSNERLFVIGNGLTGTEVRTDALTLFKNGNLTIAGTLTQNSDQRLKTNIQSLDNSLATVLKLNPVAYDKKSSLVETKYDNHEYGFIAQEVESVLPTLVHTSNDVNQIKSVNYTGLVPVLTKASQEQYQLWQNRSQQTDTRMEELNKENAQLKLEIAKIQQQHQNIEMLLKELEQTAK